MKRYIRNDRSQSRQHDSKGHACRQHLRARPDCPLQAQPLDYKLDKCGECSQGHGTSTSPRLLAPGKSFNYPMPFQPHPNVHHDAKRE
jgi:hypothetical protein